MKKINTTDLREKLRAEEAEILTEISFQSKGYWDYPPEYFDIWKDELTITGDYIRNKTAKF